MDLFKQQQKEGVALKITDLLSECKADNSDMYEFLEIHPKQLISTELRVPVWRIHYSYVTARGNLKEADKYIIDYEFSWDRIEIVFGKYIQELNDNYPERKVSNVKILDASFLGEVFLKLE